MDQARYTEPGAGADQADGAPGTRVAPANLDQIGLTE
jgi:hypothetical protein